MPTWLAVLLGLVLGLGLVALALSQVRERLALDWMADHERQFPLACGKCAYWEAGEYGGQPPEHRCKEGRDVHLRSWHRRH